jgi:hypothetical protein
MTKTRPGLLVHTTLSLLLLLLTLSTITITKAAATSADINANGATTMPPAFPEHWGPPPARQTRDLVQLPGEYGRGSGTLRSWIEEKIAEDDSGAPESAAGDDGKLWPQKDLVGMMGDEAVAAVLGGAVELDVQNIHITPQDAMVTMDFREDRVRIFVDDDGKVARQPRRG